ncbi:hypothetical protein IE53DRAFT_369764 [Violaceomyces palustris]|uniref:Uncharacterized protein n=1 Tax=Violaceomyces palustris TaxID=1673888 RepID=A0ACD0NUG1_9BASI|nr:hypothetical protein IE53DRAFT_369764 [Violaceomyces palustris]
MAEPSENRDPLPPSSRGKEEEEGAASIQHKVSSSSPSKSASQQAGNVDQGLDMRIPAVNASTTRSSASVKTRIAKMPSILYGTAWKTERTTELVFTAIRNGFRGIDTAGQRKHYREDLVGLAVRKAAKELGIAREDLWLQTK